MQKKLLSMAFLSTMLITGLSFTSCDDDDDDINYDVKSTITIENVTSIKDFVQSGTFKGTNQNLILPGESVSITFNATKGQALMFAAMYGYSNDLFFAPENPGIELFNSDGTAVTGDVSSKIFLWDNGTRVNVQPSAENTHPGVAEDGTIKKIELQDTEGNLYRAASELVKLTLAFEETTSEFTLTIANISTGTINETPLSPGAWAVSNLVAGELVNKTPFYEAGKKSGAQLTALAENGNNEPLGSMISEMTGIITNLSPTLIVVYTGDVNPIYELSQKDNGLGLKELAQKGETAKLKDSLKGMSNVRNVYVAGSEYITPGNKMYLQFEAFENDKIAFVTQFGYSNDWFYANTSAIAADTKGDVTGKVALLDNGTAVNQYPGAGILQHVFGGTSQAQDVVISQVGNTYPVPSVSNIIKVTIE